MMLAILAGEAWPYAGECSSADALVLAFRHLKSVCEFVEPAEVSMDKKFPLRHVDFSSNMTIIMVSLRAFRAAKGHGKNLQAASRLLRAKKEEPVLA